MVVVAVAAVPSAGQKAAAGRACGSAPAAVAAASSAGQGPPEVLTKRDLMRELRGMRFDPVEVRKPRLRELLLATHPDKCGDAGFALVIAEWKRRGRRRSSSSSRSRSRSRSKHRGVWWWRWWWRSWWWWRWWWWWWWW